MMHNYLLAAKRMLRSVYFPVLLIVLALALIASVFLGESEALPAAGLCDLDGSATSARICDYLLDNHFVLCADEDTLRQKISTGEYNCGVILPSGFEALLQSGNINGAVRFIAAPTALVPTVYKNHTTAAIFSEYAPILSAGAMKGTDIPQDEIIQTYRDMMDEGLLFSFDIEYIQSGGTVREDTSLTRARTYCLTVASLLIFVMLMYSVCDLLSRDIAVLPHRIGMKNTVLHAVIPSLTVRIGGILLAAASAALASFAYNGNTLLANLIVPIILYTLAVSAASVLIAALFADASRVQICAFFILIASFILCPIYIDASLFVPAIEYLRPLIAPYWLWMCAENSFPVLVAPAAVPLSLAALYIRFTHKPLR